MAGVASQFAALARIAALVDGPADFEHLAPEAASAALTLARAQGIWVCVRRRRNRDLVLRHSLGIVPRTPISGDIPIASDPLVELAVLAGRDLHMPDYLASDVTDPILRDQGVHSVASAPIRAGSQDFGALIALRTRRPAFGHHDAARLAQAAQALALVLATHDARRSRARALARERLVARAAFSTGSAAALDAAMEHTAAGAGTVSDAVFAAVLVADGETTRLAATTEGPVRVALTRAVPGGLGAIRLRRLEDLVSTESLEAGRPQLFLDALGLFRRLGIPVDQAPEIRGRLAVVEPINEGGGRFGGILVLLEADAPDPEVFGSLETLAANAAGVVRSARMHREIESAYLSTVTALANALEAKDASTQEHAGETARLALAVGAVLGLPADELRDLGFAAALHDVGKIAIPEEILRRRGPLTGPERRSMEEHTVIGERILRGIPFLETAAAAVRSAHERFDGSGYPDGLASTDIPLLSRIVFACDTWDVMTSDRPYREALSREEALDRLRASSGTQLDPIVVSALLGVIGAAAADAAIADLPVADQASRAA